MQRARNVSQSVGVAYKGDCSNMGLWHSNLRGKIHSCTAFLVPLHWKVPGLSFIESRLVDDDIGGNWSSKCSCHKHLESISIRQLCVNFSSLCWRKTQHPARVDKFFEGSMGARRGCDFVEKDGCSRVSSGNEQSLQLHFAKNDGCSWIFNEIEQSLHLRVHCGTLSGLETRR